MRRSVVPLLLVVLVASLVPASALAQPRQGDVVAGSYIVTLVAGARPGAVAGEHASRHGAVVDHVYRHA
ncbi:MAG: peptidase S8, partial [Actinomycetota bacterium]|nr:peptidase S8 [Actinomycetota bacterium]